MAKRTIQTCRFYADIPQYLKALGYYGGSDTPEIWNMNPSQPEEYEADFLTNFSFNINNPSKELDQLISNVPQSSTSGIYGAVLGHNLSRTAFTFRTNLRSEFEYSEIVNYSSGMPEYNGYSLWDITDAGNDENIESLYFTLLSNEPKQIGAVSFGRWFQPSHSPDLNVELISEHEGISTQTTVGGSSLSNINYLGQPNWGNLPAWTLEKQEGHDYNIGANRQRRTWKISFSYLSDDNIFSKATNENKFFNYSEDTGQYTFDTSMASFFGLTLNGSLPFLFCPNSNGSDSTNNRGDKDLEFALCKIDQSSISYKQVAYQTWNVSLVVMEVW
tara:strand:- start:13 stop:1005 length:993 start_codon:yes stop_codon:yes gene_type:complete